MGDVVDRAEGRGRGGRRGAKQARQHGRHERCWVVQKICARGSDMPPADSDDCTGMTARAVLACAGLNEKGPVACAGAPERAPRACADWCRVLCCRMFANVQKTQELWMWKMEYLHHEQRPLYFGEWF